MAHEASKFRLGRVSVILAFDEVDRALLDRSEAFERLGGSRLHKHTAGSRGPKVSAYFCKDVEPLVFCASRPDGSFAIVDGEVYDMGGTLHTKRGPNQASWILDAFKDAGPEVFERINMTASLVLWDGATETLYVVRDRTGIVPSFYHFEDGVFVWSSDVWTVMRLSGSFGFDHTAIDFFLANGFTMAPWSLIEGIGKVPPAHALRCTRNGGVDFTRYWPKFDAQRPQPSLPEWTEIMTETFGKALQRRWDSSGSSAAFLSGGMDSALVVSGVRKLLGSEVDTFTIGYEDYQGQKDERERARASAKAFGTRHHEIGFGPRDIIENMDSMVLAHGAPFHWGLRAFFLRAIADAGFRAILGGDSPECCYPTRLDRTAASLERIPRFVRNTATPAVLPMVQAYDPRLAFKFERLQWCTDTGIPGRCSGSMIPQDVRKTLYNDPSLPGRARQDALAIMLRNKSEYMDWNLIDRRVYQNIRYPGAENTLAFNHWWTTWHGLQYRAPFCDYDLLDVMLSLPRTMSDKVYLRHFAKTLLPANLVKTSKRKNGAPMRDWMRGPLGDFANDLLSPGEIGRLEVLDPKGVRSLLNRHLKGEKGHGMTIWAVLTLVVWARLVDELSQEASLSPATLPQAAPRMEPIIAGY